MTAQTIATGHALTQPFAVKAQAAAGSRLAYLDNLRILMSVLVVLHHFAISYGASGSWYYNEEGPLNVVSAILMTVFVVINQSFFMGFFFMMSSYFCLPSYDRKGARAFLADRFKRLGIPVAVYMVIVQPLLIHLVRSFEGSAGSFWQFLMNGVRGGGYGPGPMWFVLSLLIFNIAYAVWRSVAPARPITSADVRPVPGNTAIAIFALGLGLLSFLVRLWIPAGKLWMPLGIDIGVQMGFYVQYIALFIVGLIAYRHGWFEKLTRSQTRVWTWALPGLVVALVVVFVAGGAIENGPEDFTGGLHWQALAYALWEQVMGIAIILTLLVWFRNRLNGQGALALAMSNASYPTYFIHAAVIVPLALALSGLQVDMSLKFVLFAPVAVSLAFLAGSALKRLPLARDIF